MSNNTARNKSFIRSKSLWGGAASILAVLAYITADINVCEDENGAFIAAAISLIGTGLSVYGNVKQKRKAIKRQVKKVAP